LDIPYFSIPSGSFGKRLISLTKIIKRSQAHLQPIPRRPPAIGSSLSSKDPIPKESQSGVVYQINCLNCDASYTYIGKTIRQAKKRLKEHGAPQYNSITPKSSSTICSSSSFKFSISDSIGLIDASGRNIGKVINYSEGKNSTKENNDNILNDNIFVLKKHEHETVHRIIWED